MYNNGIDIYLGLEEREDGYPISNHFDKNLDLAVSTEIPLNVDLKNLSELFNKEKAFKVLTNDLTPVSEYVNKYDYVIDELTIGNDEYKIGFSFDNYDEQFYNHIKITDGIDIKKEEFVSTYLEMFGDRTYDINIKGITFEYSYIESRTLFNYETHTDTVLTHTVKIEKQKDKEFIEFINFLSSDEILLEKELGMTFEHLELVKIAINLEVSGLEHTLIFTQEQTTWI